MKSFARIEPDGSAIAMERKNAGLQVPKVTNVRRIRIKFPRGRITYSVDPLDDEMQELFPGATRLLFLTQVSLRDGSEVTVEGYGLPFANPGHPGEGWLNKPRPIVGGKTLIDIIEPYHFTFVVHKPCDVLRRDWHEDQMPPPFCYPYGMVHDWDIKRFDDLICRNKGHQFWPAWNWVALRFCPNLNDTKRKVDAVCSLQSGRPPSNSLTLDAPELDNYPAGKYTAADELEFRMSLQRALVLGSGFWPVLQAFKAAPLSSPKVIEGLEASTTKLRLDESVPVTLPCVPEVNLPKIQDAALTDALMMEVLPTDRARFRQYFSKRALGLDLMTAGPGFGQTTALSAATLGMVETLGPIFASAPTHVTVNTFATRLYAVSSSATERYNKGKREKYRILRKLIVRGYNKEEYEAFQRLLQHPDGADGAGPNPWKRPGAWSLHLSRAFWLLGCLRSPAAPSIHRDDSLTIHQLQNEPDKDDKLDRLRGTASGAISREEYIRGKMVNKNIIEGLFNRILEVADIVYATPAQSCGKFYREWKNTKAKGFAIDEAANMTRPDLYSLWGNSMMPCILAGDEKQLPPAVITLDEKDGQGNAINRLGRDAKISPLEWDAACPIELETHRVGRDLEAFAFVKYPELNAPPTGSLQPIFIHCENSHCHIGPIKKSKGNRDQAIVALDFILDFVSSTSGRVHPSQIAIITPYAANVDVIEGIRKGPAYATLASTKPAKTISSFRAKRVKSSSPSWPQRSKRDPVWQRINITST
ncbi:hypothetical protein NW757_009545 [Fusarium falciforme]|nr:hypothetical protein NW757_009545 [Fusarium falciforme]